MTLHTPLHLSGAGIRAVLAADSTWTERLQARVTGTGWPFA